MHLFLTSRGQSVILALAISSSSNFLHFDFDLDLDLLWLRRAWWRAVSFEARDSLIRDFSRDLFLRFFLAELDLLSSLRMSCSSLRRSRAPGSEGGAYLPSTVMRLILGSGLGWSWSGLGECLGGKWSFILRASSCINIRGEGGRGGFYLQFT